ncbi:MAG: 30S ribosomal protein S6 [Candidatus Dormiibacterota bacterium]
MASYELMFIVKPELDEEQVTTATDRVHQLVVANGGNVTKTASWGKRRLAYRVGQYREGYYVVSNFDVEPAKIGELERVLKISDTVFRHLLVKRDMPAIGQQEVVVPEATPEDLAALYEPAVTEEETEAAPAAVIEDGEEPAAQDGAVEPGQVEASAADPDSVQAETVAEAPAAALQEAVAGTEPQTEEEAGVPVDAHEEAGHEPK